MASAVFRRIVQVLGGIAAICSLIPILAYDNWWVRVFDFLHVQLSVATLAVIVLYLFVFKWKGWHDYIFLTFLICCFVFQVAVVLPYFGFSKESMRDASPERDEIHLIVSNVLQKNKEYDKLTDHLLKADADLMLLMETDDKWITHLHKSLDSHYPYHISQPLDNTYGIALFSKFELVDPEILYQVDDRIPSIHSRIKLANGDLVQLYAIHPTPPVPQHNEMSTDRDIEMMKTAFLARGSELPVLLMGDFNDVPWSDTTELTQQIGGLLDPREGRALFSTFKSGNWLMRWPLDHILASSHFRYVNSNTFGNLGSDHDIYDLVLSYEPQLASQQQPAPATKDQYANALQQMEASGYGEFVKKLPDQILKKLPDKIDGLINNNQD